jgi:hypothetical protein
MLIFVVCIVDTKALVKLGRTKFQSEYGGAYLALALVMTWKATLGSLTNHKYSLLTSTLSTLTL